MNNKITGIVFMIIEIMCELSIGHDYLLLRISTQGFEGNKLSK